MCIKISLEGVEIYIAEYSDYPYDEGHAFENFSYLLSVFDFDLKLF
jgi:hypothetical protein